MARCVGLVSDTHGLLRDEVVEGLAGVGCILHMGDVGHPDVLERLGEIAPVHAVRGNVDCGPWARGLPETKVVEVFGKAVYLIHIVGDLDLDPEAAGFAMVLHGHSHEPRDERVGGVRFVNPGSCGPRRFRQPVSYARLHPDFTVEFVRL